ncbi:MAG: tRNA lysidine(34) synthetase TilS [Desulfitobacteriaceae bacterium]
MYRKLRDRVLPGLLPPQSRVLVAVSGGPDSVALSHILWRYSQEEKGSKKISLVITHVNHQVRPEAEQEERLVLELAKEWQLPCLVHRFNAKGYAKESGLSFQEAAREWRYARWKEDMSKESCQLLATAHHLGDQAETILYRLLRGSGIAGLVGIYPDKDGIIRPLLSITKEEIFKYCRLEELPFALDSSNTEPVYARNRIRLELLPKLAKEYNPRIYQALGRTGELLRWDEEYLVAIVEKEWEKYCLTEARGEVCLSREIFHLNPAILSRLLRKAAASVNGDPRGLGFTYVEALMHSGGDLGWRQNLPGILVEINEEGLWFWQRKGILYGRPDTQGTDFPLEVVVPREEWAEIPETGSKIGLFANFSKVPALEEQGVYLTQLDEQALQTMVEPLVLRNRRPGDKMWFKGVGHKSLKKVYQEEDIASRKRESLLLLATGSEVLWLPGIKRSGLYLPESPAKKAYCVIHPSEKQQSRTKGAFVV